MSEELSYEAKARGALEREEFRFSHKLGQNFLLDDAIVDEIAESALAERGDAVLEIGPGAGSLTAALLRRGAGVLAVEIDKSLAPVLNSLLGERARFRLKMADIMKCDLMALRRELMELNEGGRLRVAANLPYYITSDVLAKFARSEAAFDSITILVQKEAAERILAPVGVKQYCLLSALLNWTYEVEQVMELPRDLFTPRPHVDSALIRLIPRTAPPAPIISRDMLLKTLSAAFLMRRKTMLNNLCAAFNLSRAQAGAALESAGLKSDARGEALSQAELARLSDALCEIAAHCAPDARG